jgi:hypothetical protein
MKATVVNVDLVDGNVLVTFGNGEAVVFYPTFLYANRSNGKQIISDDDEPVER